MIDIRRLTKGDQLRQATIFEAAIWGNSDPTSESLLTVFAHHGGVVLGAYDQETLVGLSLGFPGIDGDDVTYLHSHLLAVLPSYRRHRLGEALKRAQWMYAQERSLPYIGWTYDPLMAPNTWFNIGVLGARVDALVENMYGNLHDAINGDLPTHRLWVTWNPDRDNVLKPHLVDRLMAIPLGVEELRRQDADEARRQADSFFSEMRDWWDHGYRICGVVRDAGQVWYQWSQKVEKEEASYDN